MIILFISYYPSKIFKVLQYIYIEIQHNVPQWIICRFWKFNLQLLSYPHYVLSLNILYRQDSCQESVIRQS